MLFQIFFWFDHRRGCVHQGRPTLSRTSGPWASGIIFIHICKDKFYILILTIRLSIFLRFSFEGLIGIFLNICLTILFFQPHPGAHGAWEHCGQHCLPEGAFPNHSLTLQTPFDHLTQLILSIYIYTCRKDIAGQSVNLSLLSPLLAIAINCHWHCRCHCHWFENIAIAIAFAIAIDSHYHLRRIWPKLSAWMSPLPCPNHFFSLPALTASCNCQIKSLKLSKWTNWRTFWPTVFTSRSAQPFCHTLAFLVHILSISWHILSLNVKLHSFQAREGGPEGSKGRR